jgi:hypothetical protein
LYCANTTLAPVIDDQCFLVAPFVKVETSQSCQHRPIPFMLLQAQLDGQRLSDGLASCWEGRQPHVHLAQPMQRFGVVHRARAVKLLLQGNKALHVRQGGLEVVQEQVALTVQSIGSHSCCGESLSLALRGGSLVLLLSLCNGLICSSRTSIARPSASTPEAAAQQYLQPVTGTGNL